MSNTKELRITLTENQLNVSIIDLQPHEIIGLCELIRVQCITKTLVSFDKKSTMKQPDTSNHQMD